MHEKGFNTCDCLVLTLILSLFLIFKDKWALKAFSQMNALYRGLNMSSEAFHVVFDPFCWVIQSKRESQIFIL